MKKIGAAIAVLTATLTGCANVAPTPPVGLTSEALSGMRGRTVAAPNMPTPSFTALTPEKAAFAVLGAAAAISEGNRLIKSSGIGDPANVIGQTLLDSMGQSLGTIAVPSSGEAADDSLNALAKTSPSADLVLAVRTVAWSLGYFPVDWAHYTVRYGVQARLVDTKSKKVIAQSFCRTPPRPESSAGAPTYEMLVGNNAAGLKRTLAEVTDRCISQFKADMKL